MKKVWIIIILIILIAGGIFAWQYFGAPKEAKSPEKVLQDETANTSTSSVQGWQTYHNEEFGFEYPKEFYSLETLGNGVFLSNKEMPSYWSTTLSLGRDPIYFGARNGIFVIMSSQDNKGYTSPKEWLKSWSILDPTTFQSTNIQGYETIFRRNEFSNTCLSGSLGVCESNEAERGNFIQSHYYILKGDKIYTIDVEIQMEQKFYEDTFTQILSTFRFLQ